MTRCKVTGWLQTFLGENLCGTYHGCIRDLWMATQMQSVQLVSWVMGLISGLILDTHTMDHHGPREIIAPISTFAHICSMYNLYIYIYLDMIYMYIYIIHFISCAGCAWKSLFYFPAESPFQSMTIRTQPHPVSMAGEAIPCHRGARSPDQHWVVCPGPRDGNLGSPPTWIL